MPDQVDWRAMEREASPGRAVGRLLRDQREARGMDLKAVEMALRIRLQYLEAIEQGRFDLLPGAAYIPAFLRAYAQHVGLEPEKVLTAYQLSGAVPIKRPVSLPADFPLAEKRAPIGLAVLTVLLVIGAGYAVWHYLPRQQPIVAEKVPPVPDRLLASRPGAVESPANAASNASPQVTQPAPSPAAPAPAPAQVQAPPPAPTPVPAQTQVTQQPQEARSAPGVLPAGTWPSPRQETMPAPPPAVVAVPAAPPPVMMSVPSAGQAQAAQPPAPEPVRPAPPTVATPAVTPTTPAPATPDPQEAVARGAIASTSLPAPTVATPAPDAMGGASLPVRADTQVRVSANSWVELRAPNGDILAQTYVRAGESYTVPAGISYRIIDAR
jgi:cytoskeleton protein RodZ